MQSWSWNMKLHICDIFSKQTSENLFKYPFFRMRRLVSFRIKRRYSSHDDFIRMATAGKPKEKPTNSIRVTSNQYVSDNNRRDWSSWAMNSEKFKAWLKMCLINFLALARPLEKSYKIGSSSASRETLISSPGIDWPVEKFIFRKTKLEARFK